MRYTRPEPEDVLFNIKPVPAAGRFALCDGDGFSLEWMGYGRASADHIRQSPDSFRNVKLPNGIPKHMPGRTSFVPSSIWGLHKNGQRPIMGIDRSG